MTPATASKTTDAAMASILKQINPVLDLSADLGLAGYFTLSRVQIESIGKKAARAAAPKAETADEKPKAAAKPKAKAAAKPATTKTTTTKKKAE